MEAGSHDNAYSVGDIQMSIFKNAMELAVTPCSHNEFRINRRDVGVRVC
jgi:hypothetical protein